MDSVIFFENTSQNNCLCAGDNYPLFLDYAFDVADFFMLVYVNYYGNGYSAIMKKFKKELKPFQVKTRTDPHWPGTPFTYCLNTTYKIVFYRTDIKAKAILKKVNALNDWSCPHYPQDLAFFKGNICWFYSVGHENIAAVLRPTNDDFEFLESHQLAHRANAKKLSDYYSQFDEQF